MIALLVVAVEAYGHEVENLDRVPNMEPFGICADQVAADKDVHDTKDESQLLAEGNGLGIVPALSKLIDIGAHSLLVSF